MERQKFISAKLKDEVHAVASLLEIKRTITGADAETAMKESRDPEEVLDFIEPSGKVTSIKTIRSRRHLIVLEIEKPQILDKKEKMNKHRNNIARLFGDKIRNILDYKSNRLITSIAA